MLEAKWVIPTQATASLVLFCSSTALLLQLSCGFWQGGSPQARRWSPVHAPAVETSCELPRLASSRAWPYIGRVVCASTFLKNDWGKHSRLSFGRTRYNENPHCKKLLGMEKLSRSEGLLAQGGSWGLSLVAKWCIKMYKTPWTCLHVKLKPNKRVNDCNW